MLGVVVWSRSRPSGTSGPPVRREPLAPRSATFVTLAGAALLATLILHTGFEQRLRKARAAEYAKRAAEQRRPRGATGRQERAQRAPPLGRDRDRRRARSAAPPSCCSRAAGRSARRARGASDAEARRCRSRSTSRSTTSAHDPDLRRAIVAAYARMERALARVGLAAPPVGGAVRVRRAGAREPRHERRQPRGASRRSSSGQSSATMSRSRAMRDEAIDALVAVRDELRRPVGEPVPA